MNDAVTATLPTNLAPVTPTQETPATRGRVASPRTMVIRAMLTETNGELTYSAAVPLLKQQGYEVDQNYFNVIKSSWKKNQKPSDAPKTKTPNKVDKKAAVSPSFARSDYNGSNCLCFRSGWFG
jgi:hypothetical protein